MGAGEGRRAGAVGSRGVPPVPFPVRAARNRRPGRGARGPAAGPSAAGPAPAPAAPWRATATFPQQVETRQRARAGGGNGETLAAPLPPAGLDLIQLNGEIVSPKPNNQPENPQPGAAGRILPSWAPPPVLPGCSRCQGQATPMAQPCAGVAGRAVPAAPRTPPPAQP